MGVQSTVAAAVEKAEQPAEGTNGYGDGYMTSRRARDLALGFCLLGVVLCTVASYFTYPLHEAGATTGLFILSNTSAFLLGMKGALSTKP